LEEAAQREQLEILERGREGISDTGQGRNVKKKRTRSLGTTL